MNRETLKTILLLVLIAASIGFLVYVVVGIKSPRIIAPNLSSQTTYNGSTWSFDLTQIQIQLLGNGQLPDKRSIPGLIIDSNFRNIYLQFLRNSEIEHFDHFHLEVTN